LAFTAGMAISQFEGPDLSCHFLRSRLSGLALAGSDSGSATRTHPDSRMTMWHRAINTRIRHAFLLVPIIYSQALLMDASLRRQTLPVAER
jgi:hypothetical protein